MILYMNGIVIRQSTMAEAPGGIPNVLFEFPELKGWCLILN